MATVLVNRQPGEGMSNSAYYWHRFVQEVEGSLTARHVRAQIKERMSKGRHFLSVCPLDTESAKKLETLIPHRAGGIIDWEIPGPSHLSSKPRSDTTFHL